MIDNKRYDPGRGRMEIVIVVFYKHLMPPASRYPARFTLFPQAEFLLWINHIIDLKNNYKEENKVFKIASQCFLKPLHWYDVFSEPFFKRKRTVPFATPAAFLGAQRLETGLTLLFEFSETIITNKLDTYRLDFIR